MKPDRSNSYESFISQPFSVNVFIGFFSLTHSSSNLVARRFAVDRPPQLLHDLFQTSQSRSRNMSRRPQDGARHRRPHLMIHPGSGEFTVFCSVAQKLDS